MSQETKKNGADFKIDLQGPLLHRGVENAHQLWQKIGGSKATSASLFNGKNKQIKLETMNKLYNEFGMIPSEYLINIGTGR